MSSNQYFYGVQSYQSQSYAPYHQAVPYYQYPSYYPMYQQFMPSHSYPQNSTFHQPYINQLQTNFSYPIQMSQPSQINQVQIKQEEAPKLSIDFHPQLTQDLTKSEQNSPKAEKKVETVKQVKKQLEQTIQNRRGHWTNEEHYKYLRFVRQHKDLFQTSVQKKLNRVFKMMSIEIPTRTACQCRSHYSKFNPFEHSGKIRRKLVNNEAVYEKMFVQKQE